MESECIFSVTFCHTFYCTVLNLPHNNQEDFEILLKHNFGECLNVDQRTMEISVDLLTILPGLVLWEMFLTISLTFLC